MSIAEKLTTIAENVPKVYDAGYNAGKESMIDESKIIEKTVSGKIISVDDVSEIPHEVGIQLSSDTVTDFSGVTVKVCGKNLSGKATIHKYNYSNDYKKYNAENAVILPKGTYFISASNLPILQFFDVETKKGLLVSEIATVGTTVYYAAWDGYAFFPSSGAAIYNSFTLNKTAIVTMCGRNGEITECQIEVGTWQTTYEAPIEVQEFAPTADGTVEGITSISPNMTVFTDNADVDIAMDYHQSYGAWLEWNRFWDAYQQNGNRTNYYVAFFSSGGNFWTDANFKPKYPIKAGYASNMLSNASVSGDLTQKATIDLSNAYAVGAVISGCPYITRVGVLDLRKASEGAINVVINCTSLKTIDKIIFKNDGTQYSSSAGFVLTGCSSLENVVIDGLIVFKTSFQWSTKLTIESLKSIILALKNYAGTTSEFAYSIILSSDSKTLLTNEGATSPNGNTWLDYLDDIGWTLE